MAAVHAAQYCYFVGNGIPKLVERFSPEAARTPAMLAATLREFDAQYGAHMFDKTAPYPGMPQLLARLHARGVRMAVYSNKADEFAGEVVARYFDPALFALVPRRAPRRAHQARARRYPRRAGGPWAADPAAGNVLYVGDSNVDVATPTTPGCPAAACCGGSAQSRSCRTPGPSTWPPSADALERVIREKIKN